MEPSASPSSDASRVRTPLAAIVLLAALLPTWPRASADLSAAMRLNPDLRVFQAGGCFELATPFAWAGHDLEHMSHDPGVIRRITVARYEAGHIVFGDDAIAGRMAADLGKFYAEARKPLQ